jgi:hypothetical protein
MENPPFTYLPLIFPVCEAVNIKYMVPFLENLNNFVYREEDSLYNNLTTY